MIFRTFIVSLLSLFFGLIFPSYGSVSAIQSSTGEDDTHWLIYWLIFSILTITENVAWPVLLWIPLYSEVKVAILAWLVLPQTKGALWVYEALVSPGLTKARSELTKFPALEKFLTQYDPSSATVQARSETENSMALSQRKAKLGSVSQDVVSAFSSSLDSIAGMSDIKQRVAAEKAFDRDIARLSKLVTGRQSTMSKKSI